MSLMDNPYSHAPLDLSGSSFRLIELQPCGPREVIKCRLTTHPLPPVCPSYVALSYMWDHESPPDTIMLNDVPFEVGHSAWTFLNQMRLHRKFGTYWIDAICIDQSNLLERNHQVQMMKSIYSEAASVSIWLGEAEEGSPHAEAMDLIACLEDDPDSFKDWATRDFNAIEEFSGIPYWSRMWIVQEVVLAKTPIIYCGSRMLAFPLLDSLLDIFLANDLSRLRNLVTSPAGSLCLCVQYLADTANESRLGTMLECCPRRKATDARDMIYALLGIFEEGALGILVDYDITMEDLWTLTFSIICRTESRSRSLAHMTYLARMTQRSLGIAISTQSIAEEMIHKVFLTRSPPIYIRKQLELPYAPNEAVFFEIHPASSNPKGLLTTEDAPQASRRAEAGTQFENMSGIERLLAKKYSRQRRNQTSAR